MKYNTCENEFEFWTFKKKCAQDTMISQEPAKREKERQWWLIMIGLGGGGGGDIELG